MDQEAKEIAAQVTKELIQDALSSLHESLSGFISVKKAVFLENFKNYFEYMHAKSSSVRTLFSKNAPVQLDEIYVRTRFSIGERFGEKRDFSEKDLINKFVAGHRIIVKGNGGSGKTIFLKHLWLQRFQSDRKRVPLYIELRRLNDLQSLDLMTFCRSELQAESVFKDDVFRKLCEAGRFEFILDGFDEVSKDKRRSVERQILEMSMAYRDCSFLVSGREDDRFSAWGDFSIYNVAPMKLDDVKELISKVPFDRKVKKKFQETLTNSFYREHRSFLSNPLLCIMMLMTFNENAIIPSKLTSFYDSAFQTLLTWHDATKDSFERGRSLTIDIFRPIFSTFCLISYYDQVLEFDENQLRNYIEKALKYHQSDIDIEEVKFDFCETVNLLQKDGLKYVFVHRSFQEYFAAECAMRVISGKAGVFLENFSKRRRDNAFAMCFEIHPELVFDDFLGDRIQRLEEFFTTVLETQDPIFFVGEFVEEIGWKIEPDREKFAGFATSLHRNMQNNDEIDTIELAPMISGNPDVLGSETDPLWLVFHQLDEALRESASDFTLGKASGEAEIVLRIDGGNLSWSMSLSEEAKGNKSVFSSVLNKIEESVTNSIPKCKDELVHAIEKVSDFYSAIADERNSKEKSIDDILDLT